LQLQANWPDVVGFCATEETKLAPVLFAHLKRRGIVLPPALHDILEEKYQETLARNAMLAMALERILCASNNADIRMMLIKGTAIFCDQYHGLPEGTIVSDLDVAVRPEHLKVAAGVLQGLGYIRQRTTMRKGRVSRINFVDRNGLAHIDLHGHLRWKDFGFSIFDEDEIWRCARIARMGDSEVLVPSIEHELAIRFLHDVVIGPYNLMLRSLTRLYYFGFQLHAYRTIADWARLRNLMENFGYWKAFAYHVLLVERQLGLTAPEITDAERVPLLRQSNVLMNDGYARIKDSHFHDRLLLLRLNFDVSNLCRFLRIQISDWIRMLSAGIRRKNSLHWKFRRAVELLREDFDVFRRYFFNNKAFK
jgi:hypothetical protein